jgi:AcrR family transcriptional regulator
MGSDTRGNETKAALLEAAKRLIRERGYAGTSVRDLAAASGANLAAVNYHFGSREKLLNRAVLESFLEWADSIGQVSSRLTSTDPNAGPLEHMAAQARPLLADFPERLPLFVVGLEAMLQAQRSPELKRQLAEHYAEQRRLASEYIIAGTPNYVPPPEDPTPPRMVVVAASFMLAVIDGLLLQALLDPDAIPTGEELAAFYEGLAAITRATGPAASADSESDSPL